MTTGTSWQPLSRLRVGMRWLRWLSHRQRQTLLMMLLAALTEARFDVFSHPLRLTLVAVAGLALLAGFLWHQWHHREPVLHVRALRQRVVLTGLAMYFVYYMISNLSGYLFPIYAEQALRIPLATTGWLNTFAAQAVTSSRTATAART